jgi:hypothetical protein
MARCLSGPDRIAASDQNNGYCVISRMGCLRDGIIGDDNHVGVPVDDPASKIGEALGPPFAGIPLPANPVREHKNGGTLEKAAAMANHASTRTTQLYDRQARGAQPR